MIWYPKSSVKFLTTFPLAERYEPKAFKNGDEPICAICCGYAVLADGYGLVAVARATKAYDRSLSWRKPLELLSADEARAVIGRAPLTAKWFFQRGWVREEIPAIGFPQYKGKRDA